MAGAEVTRVYAAVEPKIVRNFVSSLNAQIKTALAGKTFDAKVNVNIDADTDTSGSTRSIRAGFKHVSRQVQKERVRTQKEIDKDRKINVFDVFSGGGGIKNLFKGTDSAGSGIKAFANTVSAASEGAEAFGRTLNNFGAVGAAAGIALQAISKQFAGLSSAAAGGETAAGGLAAALGEAAATGGISAIIGIITIGVTAMASAFLAGAAAAAGMIVVSILLGAALSTLAAGIGAVGSAALAVVPGLAGLAGIVAVFAAAIVPVVGALQDFMTAENAAPAAVGKTTKAIKTQAAAAMQYALAQKQASQAVKDAVLRETNARKDLTKAQKDALETIRDLKREVEGAADKEEAATLRLIDARNAVNALNPHSVDPEAILEYRKALLEQREAERNLQYTKEDNIKTEAKYRDARKKGVSGDERVIDANERLAESIRAVQRAKDQQKVAALKPDPAASPAVADTSGVRKAAASFGKLTAAGQGFVNVLKQGREFLQGVSDIAQNTILPAMTAASKALSFFGPLIKTFAGEVGKSIGQFVTTVVAFLTRPEIKKLITDMLGVISQGAGLLLQGLAAGLAPLLTGLFTFLKNSGPLFAALGTAFQIIGEHLGTFFQILAQPGVMKAFSSILVSMATFFGQAAGTIADFLAAIAPIIAQILPKLNGAFLFLVNSVLKVLVALMQGGAINGFIDFMLILAQILQQMVSSGMMAQFSDIMGQILTQLGGELIAAFQTMLPMMPQFFQGLLLITSQFIKLLPSILQILPELMEFILLITKEFMPYIPTLLQLMKFFVQSLMLLTRIFFLLLVPTRNMISLVISLGKTIGVGLVSLVKGAVNTISTWWGKLKEAFRAPIAFVVNTVYNDGIRPVVNKVRGLLGQPEMERIPGFATGGHVQGKGSGTSDSIMARLSNGEFVIPAWLVKKLGVGFFENLRQGNMPGFAGGGFLDKITSGVKKGASFVGEKAGKGLDFLKEQAGKLMKGLAPLLDRLLPQIPGGPFGDMLGDMIRNLFAGAGVFDNGGVLPAGGMAINLSGKPEAVMTARQFKNNSGGNGGGLTTINKITNMDVAVRGEGDIQILARRINSDI